ncbi:MAG TPA: alpha/beta fold hydrolase [Longimicrobiaceae bacterium]|nr:alpha/beta fold hydrolase [Longimicrobiaceae bacterium]
MLRIPELADALADWLDALGQGPVVLVGNSPGCQVIADLALRRRTSVRAAVLAGPTMDPHARTAPRQIGRWLLDWTLEPSSPAAACM